MIIYQVRHSCSQEIYQQNTISSVKYEECDSIYYDKVEIHIGLSPVKNPEYILTTMRNYSL